MIVLNFDILMNLVGIEGVLDRAYGRLIYCRTYESRHYVFQLLTSKGKESGSPNRLNLDETIKFNFCYSIAVSHKKNYIHIIKKLFLLNLKSDP